MSESAEHACLTLIRGRRSAENFDAARPLDEAQLRELIEDATHAPSSFNLQHWRFVAVRRAEDKQRLRAAAYQQRQVSEAAVTLILLGDLRATERLAEVLERAVEAGVLAAGKAAAWVRQAAEIYAEPQAARDEAIRSCSLAAMTLMLAAEARGLKVSPLTGFEPERVRAEFGIGARYLPVMLLCVGHAAPGGESRRLPRLSVEEILRFDHGDGL
ncbi:MAG TPA: nitroreductase family protein [Candidatus Polarisedimenticolaceae bacterium]|nr:nitroreductase family protein [Candidatus Polarisedimenticolaceae bacterium]